MKAYSYPDGLLYFCLCDRGVRDAMDIGKESYLVKLCQPIILAIFLIDNSSMALRI